MPWHVLVLVCLLVLAPPVEAVSTSALVGTWEAARTPDDARLYVNLKKKGTAEIVAEYKLKAAQTAVAPGAPAQPAPPSN